MSGYLQAVNLIRSIAEAINTSGFFTHARNFDNSLNFDEDGAQIVLFPLSKTIDQSNNYFEQYNCAMAFLLQDAPDSTPEQRELIINDADNLLRLFALASNGIDGYTFSTFNVRTEYRINAGTYSGLLVNFTLSLSVDVCSDEVPPVIIPIAPTLCEAIEICLGISEDGSVTKFLNEQGQWVTVSGGGGAVDSVNGQTGVVVLDADDIGLGNVDNTSDLDKPISNATQDALDDKQNTLTLTTIGDSGVATLIGDTLNIPEYASDQNNIPKVVYITLQSLGVTTFEEVTPTLISAYIASLAIVISETELYFFEVVEHNFEVVLDWLALGVTDQATFTSFIDTKTATPFTVGGFSLVGNTIFCALIFDQTSLFLDLSDIGITNVIRLNVDCENLALMENSISTFNPEVALHSNLKGLYLGENGITVFNPSIALPPLLEVLHINFNQLVFFNPSIPLPTSLTNLYLFKNQMTTAGYVTSEAWATAQPSFTSNCLIKFDDNTDSVTGTNLETILLTKNTTITA